MLPLFCGGVWGEATSIHFWLPQAVAADGFSVSIKGGTPDYLFFTYARTKLGPGSFEINIRSEFFVPIRGDI
jgi:hypothetical protein